MIPGTSSEVAFWTMLIFLIVGLIVVLWPKGPEVLPPPDRATLRRGPEAVAGEDGE